MGIPVVPYLSGGRELCVTGACLLTASSGLLGSAIRLFEKGEAFCSHAAGVVRFPESLVSRERVTLIESLEHGPTPTYLSRYFSGFDGRLFLFTPEGLTPEIQTGFSAWLLDKVLSETPYGYGDIGHQVVGRVKQDAAELFCSEAVGMAWEENGLPRLPSAPAGLAPQPPDITVWWAGTLVELVGPFRQAEAA
jgi:hypothetical protein